MLKSMPAGMANDECVGTDFQMPYSPMDCLLIPVLLSPRYAFEFSISCSCGKYLENWSVVPLFRLILANADGEEADANGRLPADVNQPNRIRQQSNPPTLSPRALIRLNYSIINWFECNDRESSPPLSGINCPARHWFNNDRFESGRGWEKCGVVSLPPLAGRKSPGSPDPITAARSCISAPPSPHLTQ